MKFSILLALFLFGCGGGGGGGSDPAPVVVSAVSHQLAISKTVFIGDSITAFWPLAHYFTGTTIDKGIPGDTTSGMLARFNADVVALAPANVVILGGTNDPFATAVPDVIAMARTARAAGINVILCLIPPREFAVSDFNNALLVAAGAEGFTLVDYYTPMKAPDGNANPELFLPDNIHPNAAGYDVMFAQLRLVL